MSISPAISPSVRFRGDLFVLDLKWLFPSPPFPPGIISNCWLSCVKSWISKLPSSEKICVPTGTFRINGAPDLPVMLRPLPDTPFSALKCLL